MLHCQYSKHWDYFLDAPEVSTRPYMTGYYEEDTDLRCYVQSLVPFTVTWYKEGLRISQEQRFPWAILIFKLCCVHFKIEYPLWSLWNMKCMELNYLVSNFRQTSEVILTVPEVTMVSEGYYSCNATNVAGRASSVIFLDVKGILCLVYILKFILLLNSLKSMLKDLPNDFCTSFLIAIKHFRNIYLIK